MKVEQTMLVFISIFSVYCVTGCTIKVCSQQNQKRKVEWLVMWQHNDFSVRSIFWTFALGFRQFYFEQSKCPYVTGACDIYLWEGPCFFPPPQVRWTSYCLIKYGFQISILLFLSPDVRAAGNRFSRKMNVIFYFIFYLACDVPRETKKL